MMTGWTWSSCARGLEKRQGVAHQREVTKEVRRELKLESVLGLMAGRGNHDAGVVHPDVDRAAFTRQHLAELVHRPQRGEVQYAGAHHRIGCLGGDPVNRGG